jgi:hypothetical protein
MFAKFITSHALNVAILLFIVTMTARAVGSAHDADKIRHFSSIEQMTNYFSKAAGPIEPLGLKRFKNDHFVFCAFPYSGLDTIDLYSYVKDGDAWVLQMLYFHLRPKQRHLRAVESNTQITIFCGEDEVVRLTPDLQLNSIDQK